MHPSHFATRLPVNRWRKVRVYLFKTVMWRFYLSSPRLSNDGFPDRWSSSLIADAHEDRANIYAAAFTTCGGPILASLHGRGDFDALIWRIARSSDYAFGVRLRAPLVARMLRRSFWRRALCRRRSLPNVPLMPVAALACTHTWVRMDSVKCPA